MTFAKAFFVCLTLSTGSFHLFANSFARAYGYVGSYPTPMCSEIGVSSASTSCSASLYGYSAAANSTSTLQPNGSGVLEVFAQAAGDPAAGVGQAEFSDLLTVKGVTGSGTLQIAFTGTQSAVVGTGPNGISSLFEVRLGNQFSELTIPIPRQPSTLAFPITFNSSYLFTVDLFETLYGDYGADGYPELRSIAAAVNFPAFTIFDSEGGLLPNGTVELTNPPEPVPEPRMLSLFCVGFAVFSQAWRALKSSALRRVSQTKSQSDFA